MCASMLQPQQGPGLGTGTPRLSHVNAERKSQGAEKTAGPGRRPNPGVLSWTQHWGRMELQTNLLRGLDCLLGSTEQKLLRRCCYGESRAT